MALGRRGFAIALLAGTALATSTGSYANAQGRIAILRKIPWKPIVDGVTTAINVLINLFPHTPTPPPPSTGKPAFCNISEADLIDIEFAIQALRLSVGSAPEPTAKGSDQGVIPALMAFSHEPDDAHWERARAALTQFLNNGDVLLKNVMRIIGPDRQWSRLGLDEKSVDVLKITQALESMPWAKGEFLRDRNGEGSSSSEGVEDLLQFLKDFPQLTAGALQQLADAAQQRRSANCP